ncbi:MAG: hypothetical protein M5U28_08250 [Sandaracinaceae bacterium]|nr:hypothetical protein [Sandaracinaceae bacterium]
MATGVSAGGPLIQHTAAFRARRALNWFPLGLTYALLYMGRYNLTVAKNSLGELMTKEDFGIIFFVGTLVYAFAFLINGPLVDRIGGRKGMLIAALGAAVSNAAMGAYLHSVIASGEAADAPLRLVFSVLYAVNMYFPELRRRLDRQGQRALVPRERARRLLGDLRHDDLERDLSSPSR